MKYILTHDDADGLISHAIIYRGIGADKDVVKHLFANYRDFAEKISSIGSEEGEIILADIGYNKGSFEALKETVSEFNGDFSGYDHHEWPEEAKDTMKQLSKEFIVNEHLCASEIVKNAFLPEDDVAIELAKIARAHDFHKSGTKGSEYHEIACKIQDVITSGFDKSKIVEYLSGGHVWNDDFEKAFQKYKPLKDAAIGEMDQTITEYELLPDMTVSLAYVQDMLESKDVRDYLMGNTESAVIIGLWRSGRVAYEMRDDENKPLLEKIKHVFKGGGRGLAGGGVYEGVKDSGDYKESFEKMVNLIAEKSEVRL